MSFQKSVESGEVIVLSKTKTTDEILLVISFNEDGLKALPVSGTALGGKSLELSDILSSDISLPNLRASFLANSRDLKSSAKTYSWSEVKFPFSLDQRVSWAFGMTYLDHQNETGIAESVLFQKEIQAPVHMGERISWRPHLDYETEVGLLVDLKKPNKVGYFLAVDFTDRGVQVMNYVKSQPAPSFRKAKSFAQGLGLGSIAVFGDARVWPMLGADLDWNGQRVQALRATDCAIPIQGFLERVKEGQANQSTPAARDFDVILTGTPGGVIFRGPSTWESVRLFLSTFSMTGAKKAWLSRFAFMKPQDRLSFKSSELGYGEIQVAPD